MRNITSVKKSTCIVKVYWLVSMSTITQYFQRKDGLLDPGGDISTYLPPRAISLANSEILKSNYAMREPKKRGSYNRYNPEDRAKIGKYACRNGVAATSRMFTRKMGHPVSIYSDCYVH